MCIQSGLNFTGATIKHIAHPVNKLSVSNMCVILANTHTRDQRLTTCMQSRLAFAQATVEHASHPLIKSSVSNMDAIEVNTYTQQSKANNAHVIGISLCLRDSPKQLSPKS